MNTAQKIAIASRPDTHTVMGVRLRPFCCGHWQTMVANDVSFLRGGEHGLSDLVVSVLICSETYDGFLKVIDNGGYGKSIERWSNRLRGGISGRIKRRTLALLGRKPSVVEITGIDFQAECVKFQTYLDEMGATGNVVNEWARPVTKRLSDESGPQLESPEMVLIPLFLSTEMGYSENDALNMPLPLARWKIAVHAERKGGVRIVDTEYEAEAKKSAEAFARDYFAGKVTL